MSYQYNYNKKYIDLKKVKEKKKLSDNIFNTNILSELAQVLYFIDLFQRSLYIISNVDQNIVKNSDKLKRIKIYDVFTKLK